MKLKPLHPNFKLPMKGSIGAGGIDIFMPEDGTITYGEARAVKVPLGFSAEVPEGFVALLLPRSGKGANHGLELNNTCGVIDSDYRGEWVAALRVKNPGETLHWKAGDALIQMILVPCMDANIRIVDDLSSTARGTGGFGSTGN